MLISPSHELSDNREPKAAIRNEIDDESAQSGQLGAVEDEHLRDEDPHEDAAHEPVIRGDP
jgi:hypothetical protein